MELKMKIPTYPVLFYKPSTALGGPLDPIVIPKLAQIDSKVDYECELVVVIGKPAKDVSEDHALDYVFGYAVGNDISERAWQIEKGGSQWSLGKMFDGWAPFGPAIVSSDLIPNPDGLEISTELNGKIVQREFTSDMIFSVKQAIAFLSQGVTLLPGDIIFMGTPSGVGSGKKPPVWLKHGDKLKVALSQVGTIENEVKFERASVL